MRIAVIGGGIAGMMSWYLLRRQHDVTLFEANAYLISNYFSYLN